MQENSNFFSDPKVIISLLAILISTVSLIWTLANQWEQNRRWEKLNNGNPELKEVRLINWKELNESEAHSTEWGYKPDIYGKGEAMDNYVLPYYLIVRDSTNNKIEGINKAFTIVEIHQELQRINYKGKNIIINKFFRPKFVFENMGKTETKELTIKIDAKLPDQDWLNVFTSNTSINLAGGQSSAIVFDFELPLNLQLPRQISFKVFLKFKDVNDRSIEKFISVKWTTNDNFWSYEELAKE
jgi:hypothetical protein